MLLKIKPFSVNEAWRGARRFRTEKYKQYEKQLLLLLPTLDIPAGDLALRLKVGFSSRASDIDNAIKPFLDICQKKYNINDKRFFYVSALKEIVKKGEEYILFDIGTI